MSNPAYDPKSTKPGSAGWYEPDGTYHPFNCDLEPDFEFAARVKDLGARSAIASLGGVFASASSTDAVRTVRSGIDALLYEMQHPKQSIYESPADVALGAGAETALSPWLDIRGYRAIVTYWLNTGGVNNVTVLVVYTSHNGVLQNRDGFGFALTPGSYVRGTRFAADTTNTYNPIVPDAYMRIGATSAVGSTGRCYVVGTR